MHRNWTFFLTGLLFLSMVGPIAAAPMGDTHDAMGSETAICHVCRVHEGEVEPETVVATAEHGDETYGFCSAGCRDKFVEEPAEAPAEEAAAE